MKQTKVQLNYAGWLVLPIIVVGLILELLWLNIRPVVWPQSTQPAQTSRVLSQTDQQLEWQGQDLITLWFDDAWESQYTAGLPVLQQHQLTAALAVPTGHIGFPAYMTWPQINRLKFLGWEITAHSRHHPCEIEQLTPAQIKQETNGALLDLLQYQIHPQIYVVPCGRTNQWVEQAVKLQYAALRTTEGEFNPLPIPDPYALGGFSLEINTRIEQVEEWLTQLQQNPQPQWLILIFHQIDNSGEQYSITPHLYQEIIQAVKDSGVQVVNPGPVIMNLNQQTQIISQTQD